jgi:4-aminobutyrate aminotransferase-like enzyme
MKDRRVLMSNTGPRGDVLKVRPPLVLAERHVDHLVSALRDVLTSRDF